MLYHSVLNNNAIGYKMENGTALQKALIQCEKIYNDLRELEHYCFIHDICFGYKAIEALYINLGILEDLQEK